MLRLSGLSRQDPSSIQELLELPAACMESSYGSYRARSQETDDSLSEMPNMVRKSLSTVTPIGITNRSLQDERYI